MDNNSELNVSRQVDEWVNERISRLSPGEEYQPDVAHAFARFESGRARVRTRRWTWAIAAVVVVGLLAFPAPRVLASRCVDACQSLLFGRPPAPSFDALKAQPAPGFTLNDATGAALRLSNYKGKVVLLNFWATWCGPCKAEIPWFIEFERAHKDQGFAVIGISLDDDGWKSVRPYLDVKKINYRVAIDDGTVAQTYGGVDSLPETILIDRNGRIVTRHIGLVSKSTYENEIAHLLKQ